MSLVAIEVCGGLFNNFAYFVRNFYFSSTKTGNKQLLLHNIREKCFVLEFLIYQLDVLNVNK